MSERQRGPEHEAFFGRRRGKHLRNEQTQAVEDLLPALRLPEALPEDLATLFATPMRGYRLEIGFGGGEHLIHAATAEPDIGFIGVEPFINGMAKALRRIEAEKIGNIWLWDDDARPLLDRLPESAFERVYLYYPDPWPKRRHWKRRFVADDNVARLARVLIPGGTFRFATDWPDYGAWALAHVRRSPCFRWRAAGPHGWRAPWPDWIRTRYEAKAVREGRVPLYLTFERV